MAACVMQFCTQSTSENAVPQQRHFSVLHDEAAILQSYFRKVAKAETMRCLSEVNPLSYSGLGMILFFLRSVVQY